MNISDPRRPWIPAATHTTPDAFRARMEAYRKAVQQQAAKVQPIQRRKA